MGRRFRITWPTAIGLGFSLVSSAAEAIQAATDPDSPEGAAVTIVEALDILDAVLDTARDRLQQLIERELERQAGPDLARQFRKLAAERRQ